MHSRTTRTTALALFTFLLLAVGSTVAAQPFGSWTLWDSDPSNYFEIPHSPALNPTGQITIEGWVDLETPDTGCDSIIGKQWTSAWWVGICNNTLRTYLRGSGSSQDGGDIGASGWHHFAVTFDGAQRCHYIDGRLVNCWAESGPLTTNSRPVRIGNDVSWNFSPDGAINEIRLWNVARTQAQIRDTINEPLTSPMPGLVAVWDNGNADDALGNHDGFMVGSVPALTFPVTTAGCTTTSTSLCVRDRFVITADYESGVGDGQAEVAPLTTPQSGIFYFFNPTNWEVMVKVLNGCPINGHYWVFSAATTNVFYRMEVFDQEAGKNKVYFNYAGPPAPAVTDTDAFATCS